MVTALAVVAKAWPTNTLQIAKRAFLSLSAPTFALIYELARLLNASFVFCQMIWVSSASFALSAPRASESNANGSRQETVETQFMC